MKGNDPEMMRSIKQNCSKWKIFAHMWHAFLPFLLGSAYLSGLFRRPSWQLTVVAYDLRPNQPLFSQSILTDLVEQGFVTNVQEDSSLLTIPVGLLERAADGLHLRFVLQAAHQ
jgi:hypothetical protein